MQETIRRQTVDDDSDDIQPIIMVQLLRLMYIIWGLFGVSVIVFVFEIMVFRWKQRRFDCKQPTEKINQNYDVANLFPKCLP